MAIRRAAACNYAVRIRDVNDAEDGPDWRPYTNAPVLTAERVPVFPSYEGAWRSKNSIARGSTGSATSRMHSIHAERAIIAWATILAAVATRIERLNTCHARCPTSQRRSSSPPKESKR